MKFNSVLSISQLLALVCSASAMFELDNSRHLSKQGRGLRKLLSKARRLDQGGDDNAEQNEADMESFLMDYSLKFMSCIPDQYLTDADNNNHYGVVLFRLCPGNKCDNKKGCSSGYADFAIDVGTYVDAYLTDQADNMNWDDNFDGGNFGQCSEYEAANDDGTQYYVGPGCTSDGSGVKMGLYEDQYCYEESSTQFETISNGISLPFYNGGLVSTNCMSCIDNDGGISEMCLDLYDESPYRCEAEFDFQHYYYDNNFEMYRYGQDNTGCTKIDVMRRPRSKFNQEAVWTDALLAIMLLVVSLAGYAFYQSWWDKQKENLEKIDDDEDSQYQLDDDDSDGDISQGEGDADAGDYEAPVEGTMA